MSSLCLVAGDPSGDAHAARLVDALRRLDPSLDCSGLGGPKMREAGVRLLYDLTQTAAIGPFDAAKHLGRFADAKRMFEAHLASSKPDAVILVDFGDFNLPVIAPIAKRYGCRVLYFISPQLWAWGRFRLRWVRRYVDRMIVLFTFEERFYQEAGVPVTWVGHPLAESAQLSIGREDAQQQLGLNAWRMTIGLLPGSRAKEVSRLLPRLLKAAAKIAWAMPGVQFLVPKAPGVSDELVQRAISRAGIEAIAVEGGMVPPPGAAAHGGGAQCARPVRPAPGGGMAQCLAAMDAAIVASGTATLETALAEVPMVVVYRTSWPTYLAAKAVVRVPNIAIVNLIAGRAIVPEFIQHRATPARIAREVIAILRSDERRASMQEALRKVKDALGPPGALERAARVILQELVSPTGEGSWAPATAGKSRGKLT